MYLIKICIYIHIYIYTVYIHCSVYTLEMIIIDSWNPQGSTV